MAMVSSRLQHDIDRRVRAAYSLDLDRGLCGDTHRSSSIPAALCHHGRQEYNNRAVTAPAGYRGRGYAAARARLMSPTKHIRAARSVSPAMQGGQDERMRECSPLIIESRASTAASALRIEAPLSISEDTLSGTGAGDTSLKGSPVMKAGVPGDAGPREKAGTPTSDFGTPKLMELMEERDRAVHLCLQYRCKLKNTEGSLRAEERLASDLKSQLREANAAGEATRKLFDQVMDKVRADEGRKLRQKTDTQQDERRNAYFAEEARKTRLQLVRARKDLRELWLERDELAMLAGQAIQGEQATYKRIKELEVATACLREQVAMLALSEQKAAEKTAHAEAKVIAAEAAERELRIAVEAIKHDFEALVHDLRSREKTIRQLEAKNATLAVKSVTLAPASYDRNRRRQSSAKVGKSGDGKRTAVFPARRVISEDGVGGEEAEGLLERRAPSVHRRTAGVPATQEDGVGGVAVPNAQRKNLGHSGSIVTTESVAPVSLPARKQLTPQTSEIPGRVTTVSYPRCGSRVTFTPHAAPTTTAPATGKASGMVGSVEEADVQRGEETAASPVLDQVAGRMPNDLGWLARRNEESEDAQQSPGLMCDAPSDHISLEHSSSFQDARQPPCPLSEKALPDEHPTCSTAVEMPDDANVNLGAAVEGTEDVGRKDVGHEGGGGRGGDGAMQTEGRESAECRESSDGLVDGGCATAVVPAPSPATAGHGEPDCMKPFPGDGEVEGVGCAGHGEPDCMKPLPSDGEVEGVGSAARLGLEVDVELPLLVPPRLDDMGAESETPVFRSRLVDGVPVLKYGGGGRGKPKPKVLWVTPDLSEIFYTQAGRTKNSKKSSHMPLAGLCISRGRRDCPDLLRAPTDDRCFALVQADCLAGDDQKGGGDREKNGDEGNDTDGGGGSPAPGRRKWGIGGTLPADLAHGKRWRGGADAGWMGVATAGRLSASSTPGGVAAAAATTGTAANRRANAGARERMGLETASTEECTALVDEINELVRRAGLKHGAGGSSSRGRDLFDEWVMQSAEARRGADADAGAEADVA